MKHTAAFPLLLLVAVAACSTTPTDSSRQDLVVIIAGETQAISDVEGPYGAVSVKSHVVALRVWPDSIDDGIAEANVIVTNESWNTISFGVEDIAIRSGPEEIRVLGKPQMLMALSEPGTVPVETVDGEIDALSERQSSRASRAQQGGGAGSRISGDVGATMMDPAIADAARRAGSPARSSSAAQTANPEERRRAIEEWYLDTVEIYPGDTGVGGISFQLPDTSGPLQLTVSLAGELYTFDLEYVRDALVR